MINKVSIAVVILTYNESLHLARAIDHVARFANEIFVIDSFSTDSTVEIARERGAQVFQHAFKYQAQQFEWALQEVPIKSDWIMKLDADEVVELDLAEEISARLPSLPQNITGINLKCKTIFQGRFIRHGGRFPLTLLRIWRRGKAQIEDRRMDEHIYLTEGRSITFRGSFANHSLFDITTFIDKHNRYASREALDVLSRKMHWNEDHLKPMVGPTSSQAKIKRFIKENVYNRIPFGFSAAAYFLFRYIVQLGFLDGREGLAYHVLQGYWYRFLVGVKLSELEAAVRNARSGEEMHSEIAKLTRQQLNTE